MWSVHLVFRKLALPFYEARLVCGKCNHLLRLYIHVFTQHDLWRMKGILLEFAMMMTTEYDYCNGPSTPLLNYGHGSIHGFARARRRYSESRYASSSQSGLG
jgi:hypothetical protein